MEDAGIIEIDKLNDLEVTVGYSDHTLGIKACELAVARGARVMKNTSPSVRINHLFVTTNFPLIQMI